ncbi:MAG: phosphate acyltransferase, partial [Saezia sp.]
LKKMAKDPLVFALANPTPEILPEEAKEVRPDAILATGRTDYPNQVNNVLCFPYIFRGALDCGASTINAEMKVAAVKAIAELAKAEQDVEASKAYSGIELSFGPEYLIPKPFDTRLMIKIAPAVAQAAQESGVATRPITDMRAYVEKLQLFVYQSGAFMRPVFATVRSAPSERIVYAEGEEERILRAVQIVVDEKLANPILVGRPAVIEQRIKRLGLRLKEGVNYEVINPDFDDRYNDYWAAYHRMTERKGVTEAIAKIEMRRKLTLIGAMAVTKGDADGLICGTWNTYNTHLHYIDQVIGRASNSKVYAAMHALLLPNRQFFIVDTHVNYEPTAEELADITVLAARELKRFGLVPKVALLSHSNFGGSNSPSALKMRDTLALLRRMAPDLEVDGEMHGDSALDATLRAQTMPTSTLEGQATLLVMPNLDAANISYNLLKSAAGNGVTIGPILLGADKPVSILTPVSTVRRIVNMTAYTAMRALAKDESASE